MRFLKYLILLIFSYIFTVFILIFFPKKSKVASNLKNITIYIYYDTMHSDIILDTNSSKIDWQNLFPKLLKDKEYRYLEFGWGDRDTYLNTPDWGDLRVSTAFYALFINTPALIHLIYFNHIDNFTNIKKVKVTKEQYRFIENRILKSFGDKITFVSKGYWGIDAFYSAKDKYNIFNTCNTWTGDILRDANITMSYWTPISYSVIYSLE